MSRPRLESGSRDRCEHPGRKQELSHRGNTHNPTHMVTTEKKKRSLTRAHEGEDAGYALVITVNPHTHTALCKVACRHFRCRNKLNTHTHTLSLSITSALSADAAVIQPPWQQEEERRESEGWWEQRRER